MNYSIKAMLSTVVIGVMLPASGYADSVADFYTGRDVKIVVGAGLGGSYGLYGQLAAKHMKKYVPGNPTLIVQSMPGAGGLKALNFTYNAAPKDGSVLTIAHAEVLFETLLGGSKIRFNAQEYGWIGRFVDVDFIGVTSKNSGVMSLDDAKKKAVPTGATGMRSVTAIAPQLFNRFVGTKFRVIAGYKGTSRIFQALEQGEVESVATSWVTAKVIHGAKLASGEMIPIYAVSLKRLKALPNVPTITEFGKTEADSTFLGIYASGGMIGRSLAAPPGVPKDRLQALRQAFQKTIQDPAFLAEVAERKIMLNPISGEQLEANINGFMTMPKAKIAAAKGVFDEILANVKKDVQEKK